MKVKDKILYQVATDRNFKVGDKIHFGENFNGQTRIFDFSFNEEGIPLHYNMQKKECLRTKISYLKIMMLWQTMICLCVKLQWKR